MGDDWHKHPGSKEGLRDQAFLRKCDQVDWICQVTRTSLEMAHVGDTVILHAYRCDTQSSSWEDETCKRLLLSELSEIEVRPRQVYYTNGPQKP